MNILTLREGCEKPANEEQQQGAHGSLAEGACPPILPADLDVRNCPGYPGRRIFRVHTGGRPLLLYEQYAVL